MDSLVSKAKLWFESKGIETKVYEKKAPTVYPVKEGEIQLYIMIEGYEIEISEAEIWYRAELYDEA